MANPRKNQKWHAKNNPDEKVTIVSVDAASVKYTYNSGYPSGISQMVPNGFVRFFEKG